MIKAVFFDLYQTLISYEPPREELHARALKEFGIEVTPEALRRPLITADEFMYQELARSSYGQRSKEGQMALWVKYEGVLLEEARIKADRQITLGLLDKMRQYDMKLVPYDDVAPALTDLKGKGLLLGLISNADRDITSLLDEAGLLSLLPVVVTSQDTGFNKPHPEIFQEALRQAGVQASETIYVGDQYQIDIIGANKVGMMGMLLDRNDYYEQVTDCPRIQSLSQVAAYL
jgi:putative hydrolase of the HAD superfamily